METIKQYLDNMFASLPQTEEILKVKDDLLESMVEKYHDLKEEGKSENEAIGIVIAEFGNINELLDELDIHPYEETKEETQEPTMSLEDAKTFIQDRAYHMKWIALGVAMIIMGVAITFIVSTYLDKTRLEALSVLPLFVLLIPAVALFILHGMKLDEYKYVDKGDFSINNSTKEILKQEYANSQSHFVRCIVVGVSIIIAGVIPVIVCGTIGEGAEVYAIFILLTCVAIGVSILIMGSEPNESYKKLLCINEYTQESKNASRVINIISSIVWPLTAAFYLFAGFIYGLWGQAWVVFPLVGIVFGVVTSIIKAVYGVSEDD